MDRLAPLADRMRPRTLAEFIGQEQIVGEGKLLRRAIEADRLTSSIFWGPPGTGKTTLASIIAETTRAAFVKLNAVTSGVADVREVLNAALDCAAKALWPDNVSSSGRVSSLVEGAIGFHPAGHRARGDPLHRLHHGKPDDRHDARHRQPLPSVSL